MGDKVNCVPKLPMKRIILKKDLLKGNVRLLKPAYREDVVFETDKCNFLPGENRKFSIVNRTYYANNTIKTIAKFESQSGVTETTSDAIVKLIGQTNYETVFSTICSVFNQELKVRGILSLLTVPKTQSHSFAQTDSTQTLANTVDASSQTYQMDLIVKPRSKRRRQALTPYVVQDKQDIIKKLVITPDDFKRFMPDLKKEPERLPELGTMVFDDNSNDSIGKFSSLSVETTPELLNNPSTLLDNVDRHTQDVANDGVLRNPVTSSSMTPQESLPASPFTPESYLTSTTSIKSSIMPEQRIKLVLQQASFDWKNCLHRDEDGYLPIHVAVLKNDIDLLRRQCIILKIRNENVDIPATGGFTALKMSLYEDNGEMTAMLLRFGADPMASDEDNRTPFHIAAEMAGDHMQALISHCGQFARNILQDEALWKPEMETKSDDELSKYLFGHICKLYDSQGYTPLMLASKLGRYANVRHLVSVAANTVDMQMPNSGNTALYLAVGAACMDAAEQGNRTKVSDHFRQTIQTLLENGADPNITNFSNSSVNDLVTEYTCVELSMLIANKLLTAAKLPSEDLCGKNIGNYMLVKEKDGVVKLINMSNKSKNKPLIVANELYKPAVSVTEQFISSSLDESRLTVNSSSPTAVKQEVLNTSDNSDVSVLDNNRSSSHLTVQSDVSKNKRKLKLLLCPEPIGKKSKT